MADRTSIRWYLLGGMSVEYVGDPKPLWLWIALTWRSYLAVWRIWLSCGADLAKRQVPWPSDVTRLTLEVIAYFKAKATAHAALSLTTHEDGGTDR